MTDFPGGIDTFRSPDNVPGNSYDPTKTTTIFSEDFSTRSEAIIAIEETLGTDPQGASATVKARIAAVESAKEDVSNKSTSTSLGTSNTLYPSQNAVKAYVDAAIAAAISGIMPVGTIYKNYSNSTNPATLFGFGTWVSITDRIIIGAGSIAAAGATAGAATHTHTLSDAGMAEIYAGTTGVVSRTVTTSSWSSDFNNAATRSASVSSRTSGSPLTGATDSGSTIPPVVGAYVWRRTA